MKEITVMYMRLSKEDEFMKDESNSISNQRLLLKKFIAKDSSLRDTETVEIKDDGYSGKNMQRPGMTRLLEMIRKHQVNNIIVKDFSRFSREYLVLGQYVEQIFPFLGIRFISVNDDYDSRNFTGGIGEINVAMKSLLYDIYSEDASVKIKSSLKTRRDSGKYVATFAPYGYRKSEADRHRLIPDPEAAEVVARIFREYDEGKSMYGIAKALNEEGVSPPGKHIKERDGAEYGGDAWDKSSWGTLAVSRILHNEIYLGTVTYNKLPETDVGRRATVAKPREEWSRLEGMHEPIIEAELFERVRKRLEGNATPKAGNDESPFRSLVICRGCGYRMTRDRRGKSKFLCTHKYRIPGGGNDCAPSVREKILSRQYSPCWEKK